MQFALLLFSAIALLVCAGSDTHSTWPDTVLPPSPELASVSATHVQLTSDSEVLRYSSSDRSTRTVTILSNETNVVRALCKVAGRRDDDLLKVQFLGNTAAAASGPTSSTNSSWALLAFRSDKRTMVLSKIGTGPSDSQTTNVSTVKFSSERYSAMHVVPQCAAGMDINGGLAIFVVAETAGSFIERVVYRTGVTQADATVAVGKAPTPYSSSSSVVDGDASTAHFGNIKALSFAGSDAFAVFYAADGSYLRAIRVDKETAEVLSVSTLAPLGSKITQLSFDPLFGSDCLLLQTVAGRWWTFGVYDGASPTMFVEAEKSVLCLSNRSQVLAFLPDGSIRSKPLFQNCIRASSSDTTPGFVARQPAYQPRTEAPNSDNSDQGDNIIIFVIIAIVAVLAIVVVAMIVVPVIRNQKAESQQLSRMPSSQSVRSRSSRHSSVGSTIPPPPASRGSHEGNSWQSNRSRLESVGSNHSSSSSARVSSPPIDDQNLLSEMNPLRTTYAFGTLDSNNTLASSAGMTHVPSFNTESASIGNSLGPSVMSVSQQNRRIIRRGKLLGAGGFGRVYQGLDPETGLLFAAKEIVVAQGPAARQQRELRGLEREISTMERLSHPNVVRFMGTERSGNLYYILMEFIPGCSLRAVIEEFGKLNLPDVRHFTRQLLRGLQHVHQAGILHRDVKSANILIAVDGSLKLTDFGASGNLNTGTGTSGTPQWMSPEVIRGEPASAASDVWSVGCTVMEMLTGDFPFGFIRNNQLLSFISNFESPIVVPDVVDPDATDFLAACLQRDPNRRLSLAQLLHHPFLRTTPPGTSSGSSSNSSAEQPALQPLPPHGESPTSEASVGSSSVSFTQSLRFRRQMFECHLDPDEINEQVRNMSPQEVHRHVLDRVRSNLMEGMSEMIMMDPPTTTEDVAGQLRSDLQAMLPSS